ncbi:hypothetical protein RJ640_006694 [Escallonia rubra]|uniref:F-box domain-containing protein n=1 Tax=Escallonia rubra TaxID=112253 RepID=A0AA88RAU4_9ASTE|nr:hypothetical protein RJ640_006694 [Escallonia rubra]
MGAFLSLAGINRGTSEYKELTLGETCKRQRTSSLFYGENSRLISSLPDEISIQILARLPRASYFTLRLVARNWKAAITSPELFNLRKELGLTEEWLYLLTKVEDDKLVWQALDPWSRKWQRLPPMPNVVSNDEHRKGLSGLWTWNLVGPYTNIANVMRRWLRWNDEPEPLPFSGCATGALGSCLYVLGGFSRDSAMRCVWKYDPVLNAWSEVPPMSTGRAYCRTSVLDNKLYVVGGVSQGQGGVAPLQSAEVFDPCSGAWSELPSMPFSKAELLPMPYFADMLKPIATGMTSYRGKLCVPQSLYSWPFFVDVGGETYDPLTDTWEEMPTGMGDGWPARQAGTKLSVVVDGELYSFDPSSSLNSGKIKVYDQKEDAWKVVIEKVPKCDFTDTESPYLLAAFHGKLHFIAKDANHDIAVMQADIRDDLSTLTSTSSSTLPHCLLEHPASATELGTVVWKVIATRNSGSAELVNCLVLNI